MVIGRGVLTGFVLLLFCMQSVSAIGVTPAYQNVDFVPNYNDVFIFTFSADSPDSVLEVYTEGDLADYISVDKTELVGGGPVTVTLSLPETIETPGANRAYIGARQSVDESRGMVGIIGDIRTFIAVHVPYPGQFAEATFSIADSNSGEPIRYQAEIFSRGDEEVTVSPYIEVYDSENVFVRRFDLPQRTIPAVDSVTLDSEINSEGIGAGTYTATLFVPYPGGLFNRTDPFRLGSLNVGVLNYTRTIRVDAINPFFIEAKSLWNDPITNLKAKVSIVGRDDIFFITPTEELAPWSIVRLNGFLDLSNAEISSNEPLEATITLFYNDESSEKVVDLTVIRGSNSLLIVLYVAFVLLGLFGVGLLIFLIVRKIKRLEVAAHAQG